MRVTAPVGDAGTAAATKAAAAGLWPAALSSAFPSALCGRVCVGVASETIKVSISAPLSHLAVCLRPLSLCLPLPLIVALFQFTFFSLCYPLAVAAPLQLLLLLLLMFKLQRAKRKLVAPTEDKREEVEAAGRVVGPAAPASRQLRSFPLYLQLSPTRCLPHSRSPSLSLSLLLSPCLCLSLSLFVCLLQCQFDAAEMRAKAQNPMISLRSTLNA